MWKTIGRFTLEKKSSPLFFWTGHIFPKLDLLHLRYGWFLIVILVQVDCLIFFASFHPHWLDHLMLSRGRTRASSPCESRFCGAANKRTSTCRTVCTWTDGHRNRKGNRNRHTNSLPRLPLLSQLPDRLRLALHQLHQSALVETLKVLHCAWKITILTAVQEKRRVKRFAQIWRKSTLNLKVVISCLTTTLTSTL